MPEATVTAELLPDLIRLERGKPAFFDRLERFAGSEPHVRVIALLSPEPYLRRIVKLDETPAGWEIVPAPRLEGWAEGRFGPSLTPDHVLDRVDNPNWPPFLLLDFYSAALDESGEFFDTSLRRFVSGFGHLHRGTTIRVLVLLTVHRVRGLEGYPWFAYLTLSPLNRPDRLLTELGLVGDPARLEGLIDALGHDPNLLLHAAHRIQTRVGGKLNQAHEALWGMPGFDLGAGLLLADFNPSVEGDQARRSAAKRSPRPRTHKRSSRRPASETDPTAGVAAAVINAASTESATVQDLDDLAEAVHIPEASSPSPRLHTEAPTPTLPSSVGRFLPVGSTVTATDHLNRGGLVEALAAMLEDPDQETPLTIALLGDWGSGKSTLMALLRKRLRECYRRRFCFADFNAWEYELTDNMAAGLAQEVVAGIADDARLEVPAPRRRAGPAAAPVVPRERRRFRLSRWLSPGFWWLFGGYVVRRHGMRLLGALLLLALVGWALRASLLTPESIAPGNEDLQEALALAGALGGVAGLLYLLRGAKHILEHPFAIGVRTYLRLPRYEQHLGLVPVIKREVETLVRLWLGRTWAQRRAAEWLAKDGRRARWPRLERWNRPRRLVVFVDDLDRCSHACIGQTLDAIRLVMDVPQVVVVLGIDPRIAFQAMALQYKEMADPRRSPEEIARDYLGKIIQVPIRLRRPSPEELEEFVGDKLFAGVAADGLGTPVAPVRSDRAEVAAPVEEPARSGPAEAQPASSEHATPTPAVHSAGDPAALPAVPSQPATIAPPEPPPPPPTSLRALLAGVMKPDADERRRFQELVRTFGFHNPRQLIRLFNSYNLLKLFAATRRAAEDETAPRDELMRALFVEELLHETPAAGRDALDRALATGSLSGLPAEHAARVAAVGALGRPASADGSAIGPDEGSWRDFVRLVVLPASPGEAAPGAEESGRVAKDSAKGRRSRAAAPASAPTRQPRRRRKTPDGAPPPGGDDGGNGQVGPPPSLADTH